MAQMGRMGPMIAGDLTKRFLGINLLETPPEFFEKKPDPSDPLKTDCGAFASIGIDGYAKGTHKVNLVICPKPTSIEAIPAVF